MCIRRATPRSARTVERKLLRSMCLMSAERPSDDELPPTLVIDHLVGLSFDETITPSTHERLSGARERERVQALPQIVDDGSYGDADFTPFEEIAVGGVGVVEARRDDEGAELDVVHISHFFAWVS